MQKNINLHLPINGLSFGNFSVNLLFEFYKKQISPKLAPIGNKMELEPFREKLPKDFLTWLQSCSKNSNATINKNDPGFKIWHIAGSLESISKNQALFTFHELDSITNSEKNILKNQWKVFVSSSYTEEVFKKSGVDNVKFIPLGIDNETFFRTGKQYHDPEITYFGLVGKWEKRKHHARVLSLWAQKYGNNPKYVLNCAVFNPFLKQEQLAAEIAQALKGKKYFNINFLSYIPSNAGYNEFLNSNDIILGMSGGEGWGLPEFQSVCIGKHAVILNAHAYKDWADEDSACLVEPSGFIEAYDGKFFHPGVEFNQGNIFTWEDEAFLFGCESAEKRLAESRINTKGQLLSQKFTWEKTFNYIHNELVQ
mgnify:CR=1 FL=1|jgi:hypothetical protein